MILDGAQTQTKVCIMATKLYSVKVDGSIGVYLSNGRQSKYFKVKEFACHDGSDEVKISTSLMDILEFIRERCSIRRRKKKNPLAIKSALISTDKSWKRI